MIWDGRGQNNDKANPVCGPAGEDVEQQETIEQAADCLHDAPSWWATEEKGPRTIDTLIGMIVVAAKDYKNRLDNKENVY